LKTRQQLKQVVQRFNAIENSMGNIAYWDNSEEGDVLSDLEEDSELGHLSKYNTSGSVIGTQPSTL
jgi:hypothetical protein